ncbi:unnamed protein product [Soboliphyme baturini]|uniref:SLC12 domain-containing protein n=1 Tax=Soboliphyme baturini TaxID=241478 RepID=A0A183J1L8_9BILA|nr:unnamed protein product [Soboliphyme baturini]
MTSAPAESAACAEAPDSLIKKLSREAAKKASVASILDSPVRHSSICETFDYDLQNDLNEEPLIDQEVMKSWKIKTATVLNEVMMQRSSSSRLVVLNLPPPPTNKSDLPDYMEHLKCLTAGLHKVILVRGSGNEVVTMYS